MGGAGRNHRMADIEKHKEAGVSRVDQAGQFHRYNVKKAGAAAIDSAYGIIDVGGYQIGRPALVFDIIYMLEISMIRITRIK